MKARKIVKRGAIPDNLIEIKGEEKLIKGDLIYSNTDKWKQTDTVVFWAGKSPNWVNSNYSDIYCFFRPK